MDRRWFSYGCVWCVILQVKRGSGVGGVAPMGRRRCSYGFDGHEGCLLWVGGVAPMGLCVVVGVLWGWIYI